MKEVISISLGELVLKGGNRRYFEDKLITAINRALDDLDHQRTYMEMGKIYVELGQADIEEAIDRIKNVFGIVYVSPALRFDKDLDNVEKTLEDIEKAIENILSTEDTENDFSFKIIASRADKRFPIKSPELNPRFGAFVLTTYDKARVDVHNPDIPIYIEIRDHIYVYTKRYEALGGMPAGTNGKGLVLLSGGIDSPVAAFMMGRRGLGVDALHFHSYPYTSKRAERKVINLGQIVSRYTGPMKIYSVNLRKIQEVISAKAKDGNRTILQRRFMVRIGKLISETNSYDALITGDNLGQVASQTIKSLKIIDQTTDQLKFRPLIGFDKVGIIDIARQIGTYETSIQPYDDACSLFAPNHPNLNPSLEEILKEEENFDIEELVRQAVEEMEVFEIE